MCWTMSNSVSSHPSLRSIWASRILFSLITNGATIYECGWLFPKIQRGSHCMTRGLIFSLKAVWSFIQVTVSLPFSLLGFEFLNMTNMSSVFCWTVEALTGPRNAIQNKMLINMEAFRRQLFVVLVCASPGGKHRMTVECTTPRSPCFGLCSWLQADRTGKWGAFQGKAACFDLVQEI